MKQIHDTFCLEFRKLRREKVVNYCFEVVVFVELLPVQVMLQRSEQMLV